MADARVFVVMKPTDIELCREVGLVEQCSRTRYRLTAHGIALVQPSRIPSLMDRVRRAFSNRHNVDARYSRNFWWGSCPWWSERP